MAAISEPSMASLAARAGIENPWFTQRWVELAWEGIVFMLEKDALEKWAGQLPEPERSLTVGVAMAGNIPAVGFHDYLSVLISGHQLRAKLSSQDTVLIKHIHSMLGDIAPELASRVKFDERLNGVDAVIATGSDNTARYFEYYFRNIPHLIRKNRTSCAVIEGDETAEDYAQLGHDVFSYFGLGCRNVSKVFVPEGFEVGRLLDAWSSYKDLADHNKYANNYHYQRSLFLMNQQPFLDSGYCIMVESAQLVSPISIIHYEFYKNQEDLSARIQAHQGKLQIISSAKGWYPGSIAFGRTQRPAVDDYADGANTLAMLSAASK